VTTPTTGGADSTTDESRFKGIAESDTSELWYDKSTGKWYIVHYAPGDFDPPIATMYHIPDEATFEAITGFKATDTGSADRIVTSSEITKSGSILMGTTDDLPEADGNPWVGFKDKMARAATVQPWLLDPEVYALVGAAYVQNRELQDWELQATDWWQSRNDREREWARISLADPKTADSWLSDARTRVQSMFETIGAAGNSAELIDFMATKYTTGQWTQDYLARQVEAVTSGWYDVDTGLSNFLSSSGSTAVGTVDRTQDVIAQFTRWLGPAYPPTQSQVNEWATKLRNSASADEELVNYLQSQRMALFPEYANPNLTYEDIASPWRGVVNSVWGETPDEMSSTFQDIIRMNNLTEAQRLLRRTGIENGNEKVMEDALTGLSRTTGGSVRRAM
jgi:hypothetical protein